MEPNAAITSPASLAAAWNAALAAASATPDSDAAWFQLMTIENTIDRAPVTSRADALVKLELATLMASREGLDDDPKWLAVGSALSFLAAGGGRRDQPQAEAAR